MGIKQTLTKIEEQRDAYRARCKELEDFHTAEVERVGEMIRGMNKEIDVKEHRLQSAEHREKNLNQELCEKRFQIEDLQQECEYWLNKSKTRCKRKHLAASPKRKCK